MAKAQVLFSRAMDVAPAYSKGAVNYASLLQVLDPKLNLDPKQLRLAAAGV